MKHILLLNLLIVSGLFLQAQLPTCIEDSSYQKARKLRIAKQYEAAYEAYKIAAEEYKQAENWGCYFNCQKHQARIQRDQFKNKSQVYASLKSDLAFALEKLGKFHVETAELYVELANTEQGLGLSELELQNRIKALEIRKQVFGEGSDRVASSYLNIAITLRRDNRLREAYSYAEAGVRHFENREKKFYHFRGNGYNILGTLARDLKRFPESIHWYKKGLETRKKQNAPPPYIALAMQNIGISYEYKGDLEQALKYLTEAKSYLQETMPEEKLQLGRADFYIGKIYKRDRQFEKALVNYQKVLPIYESAYSPHSQQVAIIKNAIGEAYFLLDSLQKGFQYYREARHAVLPDLPDFPKLELAEDIPSINRLACQAIMENEAWALLTLAKQKAQQTTDLEHAMQLFDFSLRLSQLSMLNYGERADKELGSFRLHRLFEGAIEAAWALHQATGDNHFLHRAFTYSERSKASLLRESLKASAARNFAGIPDSVLHLEQQLQVLQGQWEQRMARNQGRDPAATQQYKTELFQIRLQKDSLQRHIARHYPAYFQLKYAQPSADISAIQQQLKKDEWLISYYTGDERLYGFGLSRDSLIAFQRDFGTGIRDSLIAFYQLLSDGTRVEKQANAATEKHQLANQSLFFFQEILEPLWKQMEERPTSLLIVPDGMISHFPFELLTTKPVADSLNYPSWPFLLKEIQIRYLPSADGLLNQREVSKTSNRFAGFAPVYANSRDFLPLSENQTEVSRIHELMGGQNFLAEKASEETFWKYASDSRLLHLAMHSQLDKENPFFSALAFTPTTGDSLNPRNDGLLHAYELYEMNLNAELIVLSACESGYGKLLEGEGIMSLARSFQYAGGKNIVMSLWQVDDKSTSDLMMEFYQYLDDGFPKDEALRKAKLHLLENSPFRHPYYWAGFILSGDDLPLHSNNSNQYVLVLAVILIVSAGGFLVWKYG